MENIQKRADLIPFAKYIMERRKIILENIKFDQNRLAEMDRLGKERGITKPIIVPEGYLDTEKELKESIAIMQDQLKECDEDLRNIHKLILTN